MLYSCFDQRQGLYRVFADQRARPINGDLDVPSFGGRHTKVGVPAINAGRAMPSDAVEVESSWHAKGLVVRCPGESLGDLDSKLETASWLVPITIGVVTIGLWILMMRLAEEN